MVGTWIHASEQLIGGPTIYHAQFG